MKLMRKQVQYQDLPTPTYRTTAGKGNPQVNTEPVFTLPKRDYKPLIVVGMLVVAVVIFVFQAVVIPWWQSVTDQWQYGNSKISTLEVVVGHQDSKQHPTCILSFDLNGRVEVIEFPGGNAENANSYPGATIYGENKDHRIITVEPIHMRQNRIDLLVHIEGMAATPILYNTGSAFSWTVPHP
jgi:hypothetical protein